METNGLKHREAEVKGAVGILVPAKRVHKIRHESFDEAVLEETRDDGSWTLGDNQLEVKFAALSKSMASNSQATGVSIDELLARKSSSSARAKPAASVAPPTTKATLEDVDDEDERLMGHTPLGLFTTPLVSQPAAEPETNTEETTVRRKRTGTSSTKGQSAKQASTPKRAAAKSHPDTPDSSKKRGRPKQDILETAKSILDDFQSASLGPPFFCRGLTSHKRFMERSLKMLSDRLKSDDFDDAESKEGAHKMLKQLTSCVNITKAWAKADSFSHGAATTFERSLSLFKLAPSVESPFPFALVKANLEYSAEIASDARSFWRLLRASALMDIGIAERDTTTIQRATIAEKIVTLCKDETLDIPKSMQSLLGAKTEQLDETIEGELSALVTVLARAPFDGLSDALRKVEGETSTIDHALMIWPSGRAVIREAHDYQKQIVESQALVLTITEALDGFDQSRQTLHEDEEWDADNVEQVLQHMRGITTHVADLAPPRRRADQSGA